MNQNIKSINDSMREQRNNQIYMTKTTITEIIEM